MKHFYIYKNNNLAAFDVEMARPDYFYVGQFDDERQALDHLKDMWHSLIAENRKLAYKLDIPLEINIEEVRDKYELMFEFTKALEFNSKLAFHALQKMNSQVQRVYDYLMTGKSLDRITALREIGVLELSARICQLESEGIEIEKDWVNKVNRWGEKYRLRTYKMGR